MYAAQAAGAQAISSSAEGVSFSRDLKEINRTIDSLEAQLAQAEMVEAGAGGMLFVPTWGGN